MLNGQKSHIAPASPAHIEDDKDFYLTLLRAYIDSASDGIFVICDEMKFHVVNPMLALWLGESESVLTLHNQRLPVTHFLKTRENKKAFTLAFQAAMTGQPARFECQFKSQDALPRWVEISLNKVNIEGGDLFIGIVRDNTQRKAALAKIERQANHDDLTGLINRREFNKRLDALLKVAKTKSVCHSLLYMDLDQFKVVNDTCGHLAGDELLRQLSTLLQSKIRSNDTLARLGGDEFGVLLTGCATDRAMEIAEMLRKTISDFRFNWQGKHFAIGVSIGVVAITGCKNTTEILSYADAACYVAKDTGRNRVQLYFGGAACSSFRREIDWISRIALALEEHRFRLYYQNIQPIPVQNTCQEHKEILLRLIDEQGNLVAPGEFIPAAEKYNLMPTLDRWVIQTLFSSESHHWHEMRQKYKPGETSCGTFYSINLSGASLNDYSFPDFLREQIAKYDVPSHAICFEITETVVVNNLKRISEFILELKALGFRFALDDFGSGMSSFTYLKSLPVDFLKIDGAMVKEIIHSKIDLCMVDAIQRIAHEMGIETIAEYVENDAILEKLVTIGVNYAQGYGIHKPEALTING